jgi:hypothetical protein
MSQSIEKFVRTGAIGPNLDIKTYDFGIAFVTTVDATSTPIFGKLWMEYDITLRVPQANPGGPLVSSAVVVGAGTLSAANPLGNAPTIAGQSIVSTVSITGSNSVVTLVNLTVGEEYQALTEIAGSSLTNPTFTTTGLSSAITANQAQNSGATLNMSSSTYTATATSGSISFHMASGSPASSSFVISQIPPGSGY